MRGYTVPVCFVTIIVVSIVFHNVFSFYASNPNKWGGTKSGVPPETTFAYYGVFVCSVAQVSQPAVWQTSSLHPCPMLPIVHLTSLSHPL